MIPGPEILSHAAALAIVVAAAWTAGYPLSFLLPAPLRTRDRWAAMPLLGVAYWAVALYLLPFRGGLLVAAGAAVAATAVSLWRSRKSIVRHRRQPVVIVLLAIGCAAYASALLFHHVPPGMDAVRYTVNAELIARNATLPQTLAPFAPSVPVGAINHGVPALASTAVMAGLSPLSAILAAGVFSFACLLLGLYVLLRLFARQPVAAVATAWLARDLQGTFSWGGFPQTMAMAVALLATRLVIDMARRGRWSAGVALGLLAGALPLVHAAMAASWLFIVAPVAAVAGFVMSRRRGRAVGGFLVAGATAGVVLTCYLLVARPQLSGDAVAWIRDSQRDFAPPGEGWAQVSNIPGYLAERADENLAILGAIGFAALLIRRRWRTAGALAACLGLLVLVLLNAKQWFLPGSAMLYPEMARTWIVPLSAAAMALGWRALPRQWRIHRWLAAGAMAAVLVIAGARHVWYFQRDAVRRPAIGENTWTALQWCRENLNGQTDFVETISSTGGAYLPAVAGVAATETHVHFDQQAAFRRMQANRPVTHVFWVDKDEIRTKLGRQAYDRRADALRKEIRRAGGRVAFQCGGVILYVLP